MARFFKSLVAVSIPSPVTWHNVSWAIDWPCGEAQLCSIPDMSAGVSYVNWTAVATVGDRQWAALNCLSVHQRAG